MDNTCRKCYHTAETDKLYAPCLLCDAEQDLDAPTACTDWKDQTKEYPGKKQYIAEVLPGKKHRILIDYEDEAEDAEEKAEPEGNETDRQQIADYLSTIRHLSGKLDTMERKNDELTAVVDKHEDETEQPPVTLQEERTHCVWLPDAEVIKQKIGRDPTQDEIDLVQHRFEKGIEGQVDWHMAFDFAIEEEIKDL